MGVKLSAIESMSFLPDLIVDVLIQIWVGGVLEIESQSNMEKL